MVLFVHDHRRARFGFDMSTGAPVGPEDAPRMIGPFATLLHVVMPDVAPGALPVDVDVRPHPHIGLAALTIVLEGHITHRDSLGNVCEIGRGGVGYTYASGPGVVHSERFDRLRVIGGAYAQLQILLALPDANLDDPPRYEHLQRVASEESGGVVTRRVVDADGPIRFPSPCFLHDLDLAPGARHLVDRTEPERALYVIEGEVDVDGVTVGARRAAVLAPGEVATVSARSAARVLVYGGAPVGPRYVWWNYLHPSLDAIEAARAAWRSGTVKLPPGDTESFTPAPPDDGRPLLRALAVSA